MSHPLLQRAQLEGTPLIDGDQVTFVWAGEKPAKLLSELNNWGSTAEHMTLKQVAPGIWSHQLTLPSDAYVEYLYQLDGERTLDPLNSRTVLSGIQETFNYVQMPDHILSPFAVPRRAVKHGRITRHMLYENLQLVGGKRRVYLYQPPVDQPVPLVVVFDGQDYFRRAKLNVIVDNLIAEQRIQPLALAMVENGRKARFLEYMCNEGTSELMAVDVVALARQHLNLIDIQAHPGVYGIMGASMGGMMSLFTAVRFPHVFGRVISQSGAFEMMRKETVLFDLIRCGPPPDVRVWMDVGLYEWLHPANMRMHNLLRAQGWQVDYREYSGGHNYTCWRDDVALGLQSMFSAESHRAV